MGRILGIDPGSRVTGFGVIEVGVAGPAYVASGCVHTGGGDLAQRLQTIFQAMSDIVVAHQPEEIAIERVFVQRNVDSALKLGQARGAAICAVAVQSLPVIEYTPAEIKQALVGKGSAPKTQVSHMVRALLSLTASPASDAADALACALCHSHSRQHLARLPGVRSRRRGRWR